MAPTRSIVVPPHPDCASPSHAPAPAHSLTVGDGLVDPLGYHEALPRYSWKLPVGVARQAAYRIECVAGPASGWDSGWVESDRTTFVAHGGAPFSSRERALWRVRYRDETGRESDWSDHATFEIGLLSAADWVARWIRPAAEADLAREPVASLRREFSLDGDRVVARARLYATARGLFEFHLNGRRVGAEFFANGFTPYARRIDTLAYDVTGHLREGVNTLDGLLATGWYAGRFPFETTHVGPYGRDAALLAQLEITFDDGSVEIVATDERWRGSFDGPILFSSLYDGEHHDARRRPADWGPVVAAPDLGAAELAPKPFPAVRHMETLHPRAITEPQPGRFIFDLGQNMVGRVRVRIPVERDGVVTFRHAEMLRDDGTLYTENYRTARSIDTYVAAETGVADWEPRFTFHGFRYVELSGLPEHARPGPDWVTGIVLRSALPTAGRFVSSHPKLDQLQSNIVWGWRGNALDIPTDCPQRDERMGWTGDAQVFAPTALFNTASHAFWKSWLASMRLEQFADGGVPAFVPTAGSKWALRSPGWMDAAAIIPWDLYARTGDISVLAENYAMMERLLGYYRSRAIDGLQPRIGGLGDWLQPYPQAVPTPEDNMADRKGDTPLPLIGLAFHGRCARIVADSARALGREADALRHAAEADAVAAAFAGHYFDADGKLRNAPETQTGYVLAIAFDLLPPALRAAAGGHLARLVSEAGGHLRTGFLGTPFLASALDATGHANLALEVLFKETYPSWFYSINQGATTMWERWNSYTREDGFGDVGMNSFNHYAYGAIGQWLYERVAGLAPDPARPGYKHFFVRPLFAPQLEHARAEHETPHGLAVSAWMRVAGRIELTVVVPPNTSATVELPDGRLPQTISAGAHRFEISADS